MPAPGWASSWLSQPRLFVQRGLKRRRIAAAGAYSAPAARRSAIFRRTSVSACSVLLNGRLRLMAAALPGLGGLRLLPGLRLLKLFLPGLLFASRHCLLPESRM